MGTKNEAPVRFSVHGGRRAGERIITADQHQVDGGPDLELC